MKFTLFSIAMTLVLLTILASRSTTSEALGQMPVYRLELRDENGVIESRTINPKDKNAPGMFHHAGLKGLAVEVKDRVASCGTFIPQVAGQKLMLNLIENATVGQSPMNVKTASVNLADEPSRSAQVSEPKIDRTCSIQLL